jgi:phosphatidylserine/phosphatidylglycerophosphate/cardiolipin synthase-like enzyme
MLSVLLFSAFLPLAFLFQNASLNPSDSVSTIPAPTNSIVVLANREYYPYLKRYFRKAERKITGTVFLFKTAAFRDNEPADLLNELTAASKRKVSVNLVLELSADNRDYNEANKAAGELLKKSGVQVHFDLPKITTHAKTFVIDDRYCFVGSHNFTHAALSSNQELSLLIDSPEVAAKITRFIDQIPLSQIQ